MISAILANFSSVQLQQREADASIAFEQETQYALCSSIVLSTTAQSKQQRGTEVKQIYGNETVVK